MVINNLNIFVHFFSFCPPFFRYLIEKTESFIKKKRNRTKDAKRTAEHCEACELVCRAKKKSRLIYGHLNLRKSSQTHSMSLHKQNIY